VTDAERRLASLLQTAAPEPPESLQAGALIGRHPPRTGANRLARGSSISSARRPRRVSSCRNPAPAPQHAAFACGEIRTVS